MKTEWNGKLFVGILGQAPSSGGQDARATVRGIQVGHVLLGCVQPGQAVGAFEDVLKRLRDRLHYLFAEQDRFWFDTRPNLRREMESRKQKFTIERDEQPLLMGQLKAVFARSHCFAGIHVFTTSADVPDDYGIGPRLVVLPTFQAAYSKDANNRAFAEAEKILRYRGDQPRQKQNRLIFLAADFDVSSRLGDMARTFLAWQSIVTDINNERLNLDGYQVKQAKRHKEGAELALQTMLRETYKWLICPVEDMSKGKPELKWEVAALSVSAPNLIQEIENRLKEAEWLIFEWSPIHLKKLLQKWYFKEGVSEVRALKVWQDCCHYLYLPRMVRDDVYKNAINLGLQSADFFGFAGSKQGDKYLGFVFAENASIILDDETLLIEVNMAATYKESIKPVVIITPPVPNGNGCVIVKPPIIDIHKPVAVVKNHFYGSINLDPVKAKMDFAVLVDEVVEQFTARLGVNVKISVEIEAVSSRDGFDEGMQRSVKENCKTLLFNSAEFEADE